MKTLQEKSQAAVQLTKEKFSWEYISEQTVLIYEKIKDGIKFKNRVSIVPIVFLIFSLERIG